MKNLFYFSYINSIGGIETFFYTLSRKYKDHDITIVYKYADPAQLVRLRENVRCIKFEGQHFTCETAFFNYDCGIIDYIDAKRYCLIIHADYEALHITNLPIHEKINQYYGVSQHVCDIWKKLTGLDCKLAYNPFIVEKPKKVLNLISATRLTAEKGKRRMEQLGNALDKAGIPYIWTVYTNDKNAIKNDNMIFRKPNLDIVKYIANADYLVQLSDTEAYSYTILEALSVGTPIIITDVPVATEMGIKNRENGFILPFDMQDIPIQEIYKGLPRFKYTPKPDDWMDILAPGESTYEKDKNAPVTVECTKTYYDTELKRRVFKGEKYEATLVRSYALIDADVAKLISLKEDVSYGSQENNQRTVP